MEQNTKDKSTGLDDSNNESTSMEIIDRDSRETHENQNDNHAIQECENILAVCSNDHQSHIPLSRSISNLANEQNTTLRHENDNHQILSNLPSSMSINMMSHNHPQPLFLLALNKIHENSLSIITTNENHMHMSPFNNNIDNRNDIKVCTSNISAPDSLTSAPPSYSFVLRQMATRRPRLMGTFIPSPSFVQHTPPPTYATAFDIYIDNPIPPPPVYRFGYMPMIIVCPECGYIGVTSIKTKVTLSTHLCALVLCLLCCWICAPLPYMLRSCKEVYHYCRNCRSFVGMYCPTNPENTTP